jgi:phosphatidylserine/phosphatidylglycerophosphate/cardiolipin synthase-like enzyme
MEAMEWLLLATGFTGAWTLRFLFGALHRRFGTPASVEAHFSPKGGCTDAIVRELKAARREVLILAYSFTSKAIFEALVEAKTRGVTVDIVLDKSNETDEYTELPLVIQHGLAPLIDSHHAIAHNKVILIDRKTILTGSFNFTHQAEIENAENLLILKGHPELVAVYRSDFLAHKAHSHAPQLKAVHAHHRAA